MRYALYLVPPEGSPLERAAAHWLGRSIYTGAPLPQPSGDGLDIPALTEEPRRYGFHGTIVAPFRLSAGCAEAELLQACGAFTRGRNSFVIPPLKISRLGEFFALVPTAPAPALELMAAEAVKALQPFKAPLTDMEVARRKPQQLTGRQKALLARWGYPYVMEEFRFHLTLTGAVGPDARAAVAAALEGHFARLPAEPLEVSALALCTQPAPGAPFKVVRTFPFATPHARKTASNA